MLFREYGFIFKQPIFVWRCCRWLIISSFFTVGLLKSLELYWISIRHSCIRLPLFMLAKWQRCRNICACTKNDHERWLHRSSEWSTSLVLDVRKVVFLLVWPISHVQVTFLEIFYRTDIPQCLYDIDYKSTKNRVVGQQCLWCWEILSRDKVSVGVVAN